LTNSEWLRRRKTPQYRYFASYRVARGHRASILNASCKSLSSAHPCFTARCRCQEQKTRCSN
jgi:hypothetical protein